MAAAILRSGGIVAFPTETVYGLAVRQGDRPAQRRLSQVKGRHRGKRFQVLASSCRKALDICAPLPAPARKLAREFWPGPLTMVLRDRKGRWLGVRVPDHPLARRLIRLAGGAVVATSANRSGQMPACDAASVVRALGDRIDLILDGGAAGYRRPSTVVRFRGEDWDLLREGAIRRRKIVMVIQPAPTGKCRSTRRLSTGRSP